MQNIEFDKRVKELMDGHLEVSPEGSWEKLELALINRRRARLLYFRRGIYASVAVAASLLLFLILGKDGSVPASLEYKSQMAENVSRPTNSVGVVAVDKVIEKESLTHKIALASNQKHANKQVKGKSSGNASDNLMELVSDQKTNQITDQNTDQKSQQNPDQKIKHPIQQDNVNKQVKTYQNDLYGDFPDEPIKKRSFSKGLLYAFSTNLSPSLYNKSISLLSVSLGYQNDFVPLNLKETIPQQSMSDSRYAMPMAFGFQAQLPVNNRLSVGAGISYSLLVSQYQNIEYNNRQDVQQSLHYIGIPVNAYYSLLRNKQINLYIAAGMAVEKAIVANYRIVENGVKRTENYSIEGVQFSMSGGIGAELMLNKELGLYFDPSIAYYFKGNQPENIRTVQQLQYKLELGMRFHL